MFQRLASRHPHPRIICTIHDLDRRTRRLLHRSRGVSSSQQDLSSEIVALLDLVDYANNVDVDQLSVNCMDLMPDTQTLVSRVLDWASSLYREGPHRVYLVTRLLRKWSQHGVDINHAILTYLSKLSTSDRDPNNVFRVIAELVRSKSFSVRKYLQWLIATGSFTSIQDQDKSPVSSTQDQSITTSDSIHRHPCGLLASSPRFR